MTLNYVALTITVQDAGQDAGSGGVLVAPTSAVTAAGATVVSNAPVSRQLSGGAVTVSLVATDNSGTTPAAGFWAYQVTLPGGQPQAYLVDYANGASQRLDNLTPVVALTTYGPAAGASGFTNPMTTLGDMLYENATPAAARLAGDTSNTRKFLRTQASGGVAQAPAWDTIQAGDVPTLNQSTTGNAGTATTLAGTAPQNDVYAGPSSGGSGAPSFRALAAADLPAATTSAQGAAQFDGTVTGLQPDGVAALGATGKVPDAGHVHPLQPWQFLAESYGAKGDCKVIPDGAMASTSSGVLTSASGLFTAGDAGKTILVAGAGNAAGRTTLVTTIASYQSATQVTLTANPAAAVSGAWCVWGTDDTAAVNSAVSAAYAYWQDNSCRQPEILMPSIYMIAGAPTQGGATKGNAQIPLPAPPMSGPKFQPRFTGAPGSPTAMYGANSTPLLTSGTVVCGRTDGTLDPTFGPASVFGTWTYQQGARDGAMANLRPVFDGVSVVVPYASTYTAFDLYGAAGADLYIAVIPWATPAHTGNPNAGDFIGKTWAVGVRTPTQANDGDIKIRNIAAAGVYAGLQIGEHVQVDSGIVLYCYNGVYGYSDGTGSSASHASHISYICVEACYYQLAFLESCKLDIDSLDLDGGAGGSGYLIYDPSDAGRGQVTVRGLGATEGRPSVSGGALMRIINGDQVPGTAGISQPGVPASGTALKNDFYRDALVCIAGGTVTGIAVADSGGGNSLTLGITGGPVVIASGKQVTLTYSDAPTWTWTLL